MEIIVRAGDTVEELCGRRKCCLFLFESGGMVFVLEGVVRFVSTILNIF